MTMLRNLVVPLCAWCALQATTVGAAPGPWSVGADYGSASVSVPGYSGDASATAWSLELDWSASERLSAFASYSGFGRADGIGACTRAFCANPPALRADAVALRLGVEGRLPLSERFTALGRAAWQRIEYDAIGSPQYEGGVFGFGLEFRLRDPWTVRVMYQRSSAFAADLDELTLGIRFGL